MIPKRIFYVWGANEPKGKAELMCLFTWFDKLKDYDIIEINEKSTEYFNFQEELKNNKWFSTVYNKKMWAYVADYIRIKTLYENGGIYFDTDVMVLKDLSPLLSYSSFVGAQCNYRTEPAILGAEKGNTFIKQILDFYSDEIWHSDLYKLPDIFRYFLECNYGEQYYDSNNINDRVREYKDITVLPRHYLIGFTPFQVRDGEIQNISEKSYTIHWYKGSWSKPEIICFLENKNKYKLEHLNKICKRIGKVYNMRTNTSNMLQKIFSLKVEYYNCLKHIKLVILGIKFKFKAKL